MGLVGDGLTSSKHFEIPTKVIREIICNAVGHRQIRAHSRVQVAVYDDRVEVTSPGGFFGGLTLEKMLQGRTAIRNTCIANVLSYVELIEHWGTGIQRVLTLCKEAGVKEPEFIDFGDALRVNIYRPSYNANLIGEQESEQVTVQVKEQVNLHERIVEYCSEPKTLKEIMEKFEYKHRPSFIQNHLRPLLDEGKIGLTIPDKPNSRNQKYIKK